MIDYDKIPPHLLRSMEMYVNERRPVGHFLSAVICNDLTEAIGRADERSLRALEHIVGWFFNKAPASCCGSEEKMNAWLEGK